MIARTEEHLKALVRLARLERELGISTEPIMECDLPSHAEVAERLARLQKAAASRNGWTPDTSAEGHG